MSKIYNNYFLLEIFNNKKNNSNTNQANSKNNNKINKLKI